MDSYKCEHMCGFMCESMGVLSERTKTTHTTHPWEGQCEWHRMTRMTGPDCAVTSDLINTHTHAYFYCI